MTSDDLYVFVASAQKKSYGVTGFSRTITPGATDYEVTVQVLCNSQADFDRWFDLVGKNLRVVTDG